MVWVPSDAIAIEADADIVARADNGQFTMLELAGELDGAVLSYTMPSTQGRAAQGTRVNGAMVGFHLWPNFDSVSVSIELPSGFVANVGPLFRPVLIGDETLAYRVEDLPAEQVLGFWFVAFRDAGLVSQTVDIGDSEVEVASWGDDPEWSEQAVRYVSEGVPTLADLIGQPWPAKELRVVESVAPAQEGYGGWFDLWEVEIAIPDSLDGAIMLHELAHVWFNNRWFQERWMIEGFAEEYANLALLELDGTEIEAVAPGPAPPGISGLNDWRRRFFFEDTWDIEYYGYDTSYWVLDQLRREIGVDGMAATIEGLVVLPHPYAVSTDTPRRRDQRLAALPGQPGATRGLDGGRGPVPRVRGDPRAGPPHRHSAAGPRPLRRLRRRPPLQRARGHSDRPGRVAVRRGPEPARRGRATEGRVRRPR